MKGRGAPLEALAPPFKAPLQPHSTLSLRNPSGDNACLWNSLSSSVVGIHPAQRFLHFLPCNSVFSMFATTGKWSQFLSRALFKYHVESQYSSPCNGKLAIICTNETVVVHYLVFAASTAFQSVETTPIKTVQTLQIIALPSSVSSILRSSPMKKSFAPPSSCPPP